MPPAGFPISPCLDTASCSVLHHLGEAKHVAERPTVPYFAQQVRTPQEAADTDSELAIGTAKEFVESICKTILSERGTPAAKNEDLPALFARHNSRASR